MKILIGVLLCLTATLTHANHDGTKWIDAPLVEVDLSQLQAGEPKHVTWANRQIFVLKPSEKQLKDLTKIPDEYLGDKEDKNTTLNAFSKRFKNGFEQLFFQEKSVEQRYRNDVIVLLQESPYYGCFLPYNENLSGERPPSFLQDYLSSLCHEVYFDIRGRVIKPHRLTGNYNIAIPPYKVSGDKLVIGNVYNFDKSIVESETLLHKRAQTEITTGLDFYNAIGNGNIELIEQHINSRPIDWNEKIHLQYTPLLFAFMVKHLDIIELFVKNGATFDELVPSGHKLGCIAPYSEDHELARLYTIGLNAKKGYCKVTPSCFESPMFQIIGTRGQQREVETVKVAIQNGFDINENYCGRSLVDVIKQESRPGMVETLTNYQNSITLSAE